MAKALKDRAIELDAIFERDSMNGAGKQIRASFITGCPYLWYSSRLKRVDVLGYRSSVVLFYVKGHPLTISKGLESGCVDGRIMDKYVSAVVLFNEAIPLLFTKPFYNSFCQSNDLLSKKFPLCSQA
jgi:hypothetical protein